MDFENKIAEKFKELSMTPSSDIMSKVRQKRTPLYILKNHIGLHKLRYSAVAVIIIGMTVVLPFAFQSDLQKGNDVISAVDVESNNGNKGLSNMGDEGQGTERIDSKKLNAEKKSEGTQKLTVDNSRLNTLENKSINKDKEGAKKVVGSKKTNGSNQNPSSLTPNLDKEVIKEVADNKKALDLEKKELEERTFGVLENFDSKIATISYLETDFLKNSNIKIKDLKDFDPSAKVRLRYVGVGAGYYADVLHVENNTVGAKFDAANAYKSTYSAGVNLGINLSNKLVLQTGFEWLNRNSNFNYFVPSQNEVLVIDTVKGIVHIPGAPSKEVVRYDSTYVNDGKHKDYNVVNRVSYVEVPMVFSYQIWRNNKISVGINPGIRFGLLQSSTGYMFNSSGQVEQLNGEGTTVNYKSLNISAELGLDLSYRLTRRVDVFVQPKVRKGFGPLLESGSGFSHNFTSIGAFTGLRFNL